MTMAKRTIDSFFKKIGSSETKEKANENEKAVDLPSDDFAEKSKILKKKKRSFNVSWIKEFPWVKYEEDEQKMYCTSCLEFPNIADKDSPLFKGAGSEDNFRKETLIYHNKSKLHMKCHDKKMFSSQSNYVGPLKKMANALDENVQKQVRCLFNTSFYVAKQGLSFKSFQGLCELQRKNGLDLGSKYQNDKACATFIHSIAETEAKCVTNILKEARFLCILSDGSTDAGIIEQEAVFVRFVDLESGNPRVLLCDIIALKTATAEGVLAGIEKGLEAVGISNQDIVKKLVGCNFDGAAVMMGKKSGVATRLSQKVPHQLSIHCVAHNLELGVMDAVKTIPYLQEFDNTVKSIFKYYYYSPKKRRELKAISEIIDENHAYFSGVQKIRWLASRHRALVALEKHYAVTVYHLEHVGQGSSGEDSAKSKGLLKELKTERFVKFLHFMLDLTLILKNLSESYQKDDLFVTDVVRKLELASLELSSLKVNGPASGNFYSKFEQNYSDGILKCGKDSKQSVYLTNTGVDLKATFSKFLESIIQYISERFESLQNPPYSNFQVFDHTLWPVSMQDLKSYGNEEVAHLLNHFESCLTEKEKSEASGQWLDLKLRLNRQRTTSPQLAYANLLALKPADVQDILVLVNIMMTLSPCTASCERAFSAMNKLKTTFRSQMTQNTLQSLMRIKMMDNTLSTFQADNSINTWLYSAKTRRHVSTGAEISRTQQSHSFSGQLPEIISSDDSSSDDE